MPAMDLEAGKAALLARHGIIGKSLRRIKAAGLILAVIGAGINWQPRPKAAEQPRNRDIAPFAREVPERNVQRTVAHVVVGADLATEVLPDLLAGVGIAPNEMRREHRGLTEGRRRAHPMCHIFAASAVIGFDAHRPALGRHAFALLCDQVADASGAVTG